MFSFLQQWLGSFSRKADTGRRGERLAAEWLRREQRFAIVARNWRNPAERRQELDLVCRDGPVLVFVEVKTRAAGSLVPGYFRVDRRKKRILRHAAMAYIARLNPKPHAFRFDIVEVSIPGAAGRADIRHFAGVPLFAKHYLG